LLSHENIDNGTDSTFYRFEMTHNEPLVEMPSDSGLTYVTQLNHNDEIFYILFGAKENSQDIDILAQEGITIEYWALGVETGGDYLLVPIFAGNEENGYYIVRTNCEMSDFDMSETMYLSEQGVSFATNSNSGTNEPDPDTDTPNIDDPVPTTTSDDFSFEINEVVMEDGMVDIYCQLENGYGKEVYLSDETILLNGEDITDHTLFSFFVEGNSSLEDTFVITDQALSSGDTLQISFTVMDFETNTQIGTVEYSYTIS
jgi:hypothetical protein